MAIEKCKSESEILGSHIHTGRTFRSTINHRTSVSSFTKDGDSLHPASLDAQTSCNGSWHPYPSILGSSSPFTVLLSSSPASPCWPDLVSGNAKNLGKAILWKNPRNLQKYNTGNKKWNGGFSFNGSWGSNLFCVYLRPSNEKNVNNFPSLYH